MQAGPHQPLDLPSENLGLEMLAIAPGTPWHADKHSATLLREVWEGESVEQQVL